MRTTFTKWMSIDLRHDYFADGTCAALVLRPTARCAATLGRYGCRFRPREGGGDVYFSESGGEIPLLDLVAAAPLGFFLEAVDPLLEIYTEADPPGLSPAESCYHFDNLGAPRSKPGSVRLLHGEGAALAGGPIPVHAGSFLYRFDAPVRAASLAVVPARGDAPAWEAKTPAEPTSAFIIDVGGISNGRYRLRVGRKPVETFYLSDRPAVGFWGAIDIYPSEPGKPIPMDRGGRPVPQAYAVAMSSRRTTWRYHIVDDTPGDRDYDDYTVAGRLKGGRERRSRGSGSIAFDRVTPGHGDREGTLLFQSRETIALRERPAGDVVVAFAPKGAAGNGGLKLPCGRAAHTRPDADGSGMVSEIYVYL